ncbi:MAG: preprotein translocase subunit SecA [Verrucomicrobia bacterium CG_4_10_14_3_um_filter_43_23]|nr:MAG: preprotein translocase subunit SecA [Verrucomicrobia bacterium CG1_02_43_26]PIP58935.1 MAG: preprotein translocase subunit SecA [Verrucomicrobia bacterium CG22_combo_CG10-13_8_21_14_all_43_17]PIX57662.1 MAG: preprotein translocase subunit SecA [Verrucomicrobia bacterium CG_4_10_14_3_um_filter_43_23]PIY61797.1 MAG: preprotein translocase subunit SecA [Verrucomicrobia bacterium CG_4_10_14_0_8_um_filter_43_34]PJA44746.1 MAG: preprotein translocase subunit SecA [Verrucomicrobia bacterium CG
MLAKLLKAFSGRHYRKFIKQCKPIVETINRFEESYQSLTDDQLKAKTQEFKERLEKGETVDQLLPEAFAVVKNAAGRLMGKKINVCDHELTWGMVHYDVQLIGGIALHQNKIAEMATGEGKTLVATLPLYLNALTGRNCQLVTVNDYLVRRDAEWNSYLFNFLGITVGYIQNNMDPAARRDAYNQDITYGTASEFGFDYLRDNGMATRKEDQVQRDHYYCIVDEVDSVLIDEARTPLIISGPSQETREAPFLQLKSDVDHLVQLQVKLCNRLSQEAKAEFEKPDGNREEAVTKLLQVKLGTPKNKNLMRLMEDGPTRKQFEKFELEMGSDFNRTKMFEIKEELYFTIDERQQQADLTQKGRDTIRPNNPDAFVLPDLPTIFSDIDKNKSLPDEDKIKQKQAAEQHFSHASEEIHCISQLLRAYCLYERDVEYVIQEGKIVIIDPNTGRAMAGRRWSDGLHQAVEAKEGVAVERESKTYATITIQNYFRLYEKLSGMTGTAETEAHEFFDIYRLSVVSIPTHRPCIRKDFNDIIYKTRREKFNAVVKDIEDAHRRGQPILVGTTSVEASEVLGKLLKRVNIPHSILNAKYHEQEAEIVSRAGLKGAVTIATNMAGRGTDIKLGEGVPELGGLFVLGTERHESRRIDRQLRGRCSRQGDPGQSRFYISLEDNLMRLFANAGPISRILERSFSEGEELQHPLLNRSIESAQKKVEQQNYSIRKRLLQYDDVLNKQREVIYGIRNDAIHSECPRDIIHEMLEEELANRLERVEENRSEENIEISNFVRWLNMQFPISLTEEEYKAQDSKSILQFIVSRIKEAYKEKEQIESAAELTKLERYVIIHAIDDHWQNHLTEMDELRRSVGLRGYGQKDPLNEYKNDAYAFFQEMIANIRGSICTGLFRSATNLENFQHMLSRLSSRVNASGPSNPAPAQASSQQKLPQVTIQREEPRIGRNDPCPCGSGKKYKKCCGK